jgi:hypothetical protein
MHSDFISGWDRGASRSTARLLQNARDGQKLGESFKCPESFKTHTLHVSGQVHPKGVIEDAGALVNEDNGRRLPPGDNGCV